MLTRWSLWVGCLGLLTSTAVYAGDSGPQRFTTRVLVTVSADASLQNAVTSHLHRRLGSLDGVELVDARPDRIITVVAREMRSLGRYKTGIVLATTFAAPYYYPRLSNENDRTAGLFFGLSQNLYIDSADNLESLCRKIIEDFDAEQVEPRRKRFQRIK